jgi:hypothetical protein
VEEVEVRREGNPAGPAAHSHRSRERCERRLAAPAAGTSEAAFREATILRGSGDFRRILALSGRTPELPDGGDGGKPTTPFRSSGGKYARRRTV